MSRVRDEAGMTMVEVLVAILLLTIGILGTFSMLDYSRSLNMKSERETQAASFAQREVERLRSMPYANVALTATSTDTTWVAYKSSSDMPWLATETAVTPDATNGLVTAVGTWQDDRMTIRGRIYRYVTEGNDPSIPSGTQADYKRITVAVTVGGAGAIGKPIVVSAIKTDPDWSNGTRGSGGPCLVIGVVCPG